MSGNDVLAVAWIAVFAALAVVIGISFFWSYKLRLLFKRYGSSVIPNVVDLVSVNTLITGFKIQRYIFFKTYQNEVNRQLRSAGKRIRALGIIGLILTAFFFVLTVLVILTPAS